MGKGLDKFLNLMRLNDDDYDEDYLDEDDDYVEMEEENEEPQEEESTEPEEEVKETKKKKHSFRNRQKSSDREEPEEKVEPQPAPTSTYSSSYRSSTRSGRSKIVPMRHPDSRSVTMEVSVQKPTRFEDSSQICDVLLDGKAAIVNLEGIEVDVAQRIIDFISGSCYAMVGNIRQISNYIFIVTPSGIEISGDVVESKLSEDSDGLDMQTFRLDV